MQADATVLIVDRNPNVRDFLKRELGGEGYRLLAAENGHDVFRMIDQKVPFDVAIIDPDLPDTEDEQLLRRLQRMKPQTAIVIHALASDFLSRGNTLIAAVFIEKDGNSIERLKRVIRNKLHKRPLPETLTKYG